MPGFELRYLRLGPCVESLCGMMQFSDAQRWIRCDQLVFRSPIEERPNELESVVRGIRHRGLSVAQDPDTFAGHSIEWHVRKKQRLARRNRLEACGLQDASAHKLGFW